MLNRHQGRKTPPSEAGFLLLLLRLLGVAALRTKYPSMSVFRTTWLAGILAAVTLSAASAQTGNRPVVVTPLLSPAELQTLQSRQQRQMFQQRQQINRELDSMAIGQRPPRIEVPVMKPRCPLPTSGAARTC